MDVSDFTMGGQKLTRLCHPVTDELTVAILEKTPFKQLLTTAELSLRVGLSYDRFRSHSASPTLAAHRMLVRTPDGKRQVVWGSRKTILELKKRMEA